VIDRLGFSTVEETGAVGAALLAEYSLEPGTPALADFLHRARTPEPVTSRSEKELSTR
jgi:hypothetical protein